MQSTGPSSLRPPPGFAFAAMAVAVAAVACAVPFLSGGPRPVARLQYGAVALLSLALAEALWCMRPWVGRVIDVWALACTAIVLQVGLWEAWHTYPASERSSLFVTILAFVATPCALLRWYVRHQAALLGLSPAPRDLVMLRRLLARVL